MQKFVLSFLLMLCTWGAAMVAQEKQASAQPNVHILKDVLTIPVLDRKRTLRIYLPPGYGDSKKHYPVLYMHDAQNLFDAATSFVGEWGVDEALNELAKSDGLELIVVGIDNGGEHRNTELSPWENEHLGKPEGEEYARFLVEVVKPYIDKTYRTLPERKHTAIMGSSLGGLISHYAIYTYPEVYSKAGIFSPSYWVSDKVFKYTRKNPVPKDARLYLIVGEEEGPGMYENMEKMYAFLQAEGHPKTHVFGEVYPGQGHNEAFWKREFAKAIKWLFTE